MTRLCVGPVKTVTPVTPTHVPWVPSVFRTTECASALARWHVNNTTVVRAGLWSFNLFYSFCNIPFTDLSWTFYISVSQPFLPRDPKCRIVIWARPQPLNTPTSVLYVGKFGQHFSLHIIPIPRNFIKNNDEINWTNFFILTVEYIFWPWTEILVLENTIIFQKVGGQSCDPTKIARRPQVGSRPRGWETLFYMILNT